MADDIKKFSITNYPSAYDMLISPENFQLAWQRVRYFDRPDSRDWLGLKTFSSNREHNLEILRQSVIERTFQPRYPEIKYFPKASQTLRPMAILAISDRIVYQALANIIAEMGRTLLSIVNNRQSFANTLADIGRTQMFVPWKIQYINRFQTTYRTLIEEEENRWIAETDITAFYETIDHSKLFDMLQKESFADEKMVELLQCFLPVWASVKRGEMVSRGVPQGCLSSDLLANVFLFRFDQELASQEFHYLRYVDDIKILAKEKSSVQRGLIRVDRTLKTMGLLLQTTKTTVREIKNFAEELDNFASRMSEIDRRLHEPDDLPEEVPEDILLDTTLDDIVRLGEDFEPKETPERIPSAEEQLKGLFWFAKGALDAQNGSDPFAERHIRFCLWRLSADIEVAQAVFPYLQQRPWLVTSLIAYLKRCSLDKSLLDALKDIVATHTVYDSTVASVIELLLHQGISLRGECHLFRRWLFEGKRDWPLLTVAAVALGENSDNMSVLLKTIQTSESPSVRRMAIVQALRIAKGEDEKIHIFRVSIKDHSPVVIDSLLYLLYVESGFSVQKIGVNYEELPDYCRATAKGYDRSLPDVQQCYIRQIFITVYSVQVPTNLDFHNLLGSDYTRTTDHLWQAQRSYTVNPSRYVSKLDLFHEELLYPLLVDKIAWKGSRDELAKVAFPDRIKQLAKQDQTLAIFSNTLIDCHHLRSSCTEAHTRLDRILDPTTPINYRQRDILRQNLKSGYQQLVDWLSNGIP